jgi:hypothetical protein
LKEWMPSQTILSIRTRSTITFALNVEFDASSMASMWMWSSGRMTSSSASFARGFLQFVLG